MKRTLNFRRHGLALVNLAKKKINITPVSDSLLGTLTKRRQTCRKDRTLRNTVWRKWHAGASSILGAFIPSLSSLTANAWSERFVSNVVEGSIRSVITRRWFEERCAPKPAKWWIRLESFRIFLEIKISILGRMVDTKLDVCTTDKGGQDDLSRGDGWLFRRRVPFKLLRLKNPRRLQIIYQNEFQMAILPLR